MATLRIPFIAWELALACWLSAVHAQPVCAQPAPAQEGDGDARSEARTLFSRGVERFKAEAFDEALTAFQEAYRLAPHPMVRVNMANCYDRLGKPIEAFFHYEQFLNEMGGAISAQQRAEVEASLERLRKHVGRLTLEVAPDGVVVTIDKKQQRQTPLLEPLILQEGLHVLEFSKPGYAPLRKKISVVGGSSLSLFVRLEKQPEAVAAAPTASPGQDAQQGVAAPVANRRTGEPSPIPSRPPSDYVPTPAPLDLDAAAGGLRFSTPTVIAGVVTGALLVGATITGILAVHHDRRFDERRVDARNPDLPACQVGARARCIQEQNQAWADAQNAASRANGLALTTDLLLGGALLSGALTAYFMVRDQQRPRDVAIAPHVSPTTLGLRLDAPF